MSTKPPPFPFDDDDDTEIHSQLAAKTSKVEPINKIKSPNGVKHTEPSIGHHPHHEIHDSHDELSKTLHQFTDSPSTSDILSPIPKAPSNENIVWWSNKLEQTDQKKDLNNEYHSSSDIRLPSAPSETFDNENVNGETNVIQKSLSSTDIQKLKGHQVNRTKDEGINFSKNINKGGTSFASTGAEDHLKTSSSILPTTSFAPVIVESSSSAILESHNHKTLKSSSNNNDDDTVEILNTNNMTTKNDLNHSTDNNNVPDTTLKHQQKLTNPWGSCTPINESAADLSNEEKSKMASPSSSMRNLLASTRFKTQIKCKRIQDLISLTYSKDTAETFVYDILNFIRLYPFYAQLGFFALKQLLLCHPDVVVRALKPNIVPRLFNLKCSDAFGADFLLLLLTYKLNYLQSKTANVSIGEEETLKLLDVCLKRSHLQNPRLLPSSELRDWLCRIWYDLPLTRPKKPSVLELCLYWICDEVEPLYVKEPIFHLLYSEMKRLTLPGRGETWLLAATLELIAGMKGELSHDLQHVFVLIPRDRLSLVLSTLFHTSKAWSPSRILALWKYLCIYIWGPESPPPFLHPFASSYGEHPLPLYDFAVSFLNVCASFQPYKKTSKDIENKDFEQKENKHIQEIDALRGSLVEGCLRMLAVKTSNPVNAQYSLQLLTHIFLSGSDPLSKHPRCHLYIGSLIPYFERLKFLWTTTHSVSEGLLTLLTHIIQLLYKIQHDHEDHEKKKKISPFDTSLELFVVDKPVILTLDEDEKKGETDTSTAIVSANTHYPATTISSSFKELLLFQKTNETVLKHGNIPNVPEELVIKDNLQYKAINHKEHSQNKNGYNDISSTSFEAEMLPPKYLVHLRTSEVCPKQQRLFIHKTKEIPSISVAIQTEAEKDGVMELFSKNSTHQFIMEKAITAAVAAATAAVNTKPKDSFNTDTPNQSDSCQFKEDNNLNNSVLNCNSTSAINATPAFATSLASTISSSHSNPFLALNNMTTTTTTTTTGGASSTTPFTFPPLSPNGSNVVINKDFGTQCIHPTAQSNNNYSLDSNIPPAIMNSSFQQQPYNVYPPPPLCYNQPPIMTTLSSSAISPFPASAQSCAYNSSSFSAFAPNPFITQQQDPLYPYYPSFFQSQPLTQSSFPSSSFLSQSTINSTSDMTPSYLDALSVYSSAPVMLPFNNNTNSNNTYTSVSVKKKKERYLELPIPFRFVVEYPLEAPHCGLVNLGNTCYLNSFLQSLFVCNAFVSNLFRFTLQQKSIDQDGTNPIMLKEMQILFGQLIRTRRSAISPRAFLDTLPDFYRNGQQQDSTEVARHILSSLGGHSQKLIETVFAGQINTKVACCICNNISQRTEIVSDFGFPITFQSDSSFLSGSQQPSIQTLFDDYSKSEQLAGDNAYNCEHCKTKVTAWRWTEIDSPPAHLFVVLNRFSWDLHTGEKKKENVHVEINETITVWGLQYKAYAVVFHKGNSANSGHYYTIARRSEIFLNQNDKATKRRWYRFNDSLVTREKGFSVVNDTSKNTSMNDSPYIIFYRCIEAPPAPHLVMSPSIAKLIKRRDLEDV